MNTYPSSRAMPYVYKLVHKETGHFYIGSRYTKKLRLPSHLDFPKYQTSSKKVKSLGFENFDWHIVAEFFEGDKAWQFEQELIAENFKDPLCLNENHWHNKKRFLPTEAGIARAAAKALGKKRGPMPEEWKANIGAANKGKTSWAKGKKHTEDHVAKRSKTWAVTKPDGTTETIVNIRDYCRSNGLDSSHMSKVAKGKLKSHRGYSCTIIN